MALNRKQVSDEIAEIVRRHAATIWTGDETTTLAVGEMIRELQAYVGATVEAALAKGAES
jgi:hypothetical protein